MQCIVGLCSCYIPPFNSFSVTFLSAPKFKTVYKKLKHTETITPKYPQNKKDKLKKITYTNWLLSGISAGIKVNTDKNQHEMQTKIGMPDLHGIELKR